MLKLKNNILVSTEDKCEIALNNFACHFAEITKVELKTEEQDVKLCIYFYDFERNITEKDASSEYYIEISEKISGDDFIFLLSELHELISGDTMQKLYRANLLMNDGDIIAFSIPNSKNQSISDGARWFYNYDVINQNTKSRYTYITCDVVDVKLNRNGELLPIDDIHHVPDIFGGVELYFGRTCYHEFIDAFFISKEELIDSNSEYKITYNGTDYDLSKLANGKADFVYQDGQLMTSCFTFNKNLGITSNLRRGIR